MMRPRASLSGVSSRHGRPRDRLGAAQRARLGGFLRFVARHASGSLWKAAALILFANLTESLSLVLIVPLIGFLQPAQTAIEIPLPPRLAFLAPTPHASVHLELTLGLVIFVLLIAARALAVRAKDLQVTDVQYAVTNDLRVGLFTALSRSRWGFLSNLRASELNHALTADVERVQTATLQLLLLGQAVIMIGVYSALSMLISPWMTVIAVSLGVFMLLLVAPIRRQARIYGDTFMASRRDQFATVGEFLGAMKIVKAANAETAYIARLSGELEALRASTLAFMRSSSMATLIFQVVTAAAIALFVGYAFLAAHLSRELIMILLLLFLRLGPRILSLQPEIQSLLINVSSFDAMRQLENASRQQAEIEPRRAADLVLRHGITVEGVSFTHAKAERAALRNVDCIVPANLITAVVGASGGGKSTLADLILGLEAPGLGRILIDHTELDGSVRRAWRDRVAYVPQDVFLLNDTLAANLRLTSPSASDEELWKVLAAAQLEGVVRRSPDKLATSIGDRGLRLSGGERQRLALARALLRRPELLILDEATSALDWENQAAIARVIAALRGRCTVITIAHRPSMIAFADWVIALEDGCVIETGAYADLAADPRTRLARMLASEAG